MAMAGGALSLSQFSVYRPISLPRKLPRSSVCIRAMSETPSTSTSVSTEQEPPISDASPSSSVSFAPPPNFKPPEPKRFAVRPDKSGEVFGAALPLFFRFATGVFASGYSFSFVSKDEIPPNEYALEVSGSKVKETSKLGPRPEKPIEIYEFESCPFCRKVDPNTGVSMYESDDIIRYLVGKYGDGNVPLALSLGFLTSLTCGLAMLSRIGKGTTYTPAKLPPKPLIVWAYEGSPFCKLVREVLVELELPHLLRSCARGSPKRNILYQRTGHFQAPFLEDPNTGVEMFESAEIIEYLKATYALQ